VHFLLQKVTETLELLDLWETIAVIEVYHVDPGGRAIAGVGVRPLACWDCGFEYRQVHGYLALVSVVSGGGL
jgi:hypothetical protein